MEKDAMHEALTGRPELLAPAGDLVMLRAAIAAGCDALYFGVKGLNMRVSARNFEISQMAKVVGLCHDNGIKAYLTLNAIIYDHELGRLATVLDAAADAGVDAVIAWDFAVITRALEKGLKVHLSTQASVSNASAAAFYQKLGIQRIVLARECSLDAITSIKAKTGMAVEVFCHGAMCVSISGRCFLSQFLTGRSGNRGDCLQPCRRRYIVKDAEDGHELALENSQVMSPRDLCTIDFLDRLVAAGIDAFKIEGRAKSPEYVKVVVGCYREALDACLAGGFTATHKVALKKRMGTVFNREFSSGFFMGAPIDEFTGVHGNASPVKKLYVGRVVKLYRSIKVAEVKVEKSPIAVGDHLQFQGPVTGVLDADLTSMEVEHEPVQAAEKGMLVGIRVPADVRPKDKVFCIKGARELSQPAGIEA